MQKNRYLKLFGIILFLIILFIVFEASGLRQNINLQFLRNLIENNFILGLFIFIALFALGNLIQLPGWIFLGSAVLTLGQLGGGIVTYIGAVSSCLITYAIIRFMGNNALRELESPLAQRIFKNLDDYPVTSITLLRIIFQTLPILNYSLAMSGVKFRAYLIGTVVGLPLPIFIYVSFFDFLAQNIFNIQLT